ncbi:ABC transporter permease [Caulobacter sp. LARHSG274]
MNAFGEIVRALVSWRIWTSIAVDDVIGRYRRTVLGPIWLVVAQGAFVAGLYLLHRTGFGGGSGDYLSWLAISLPLWGLIVSLITDGTSALTRSKGMIESYPLPMALYIIRSVAASFVTFAHLILVYVIVCVITLRFPGPTAVLSLAGLAIVAIFGLGVGLLLGPLGARFRDLGPAATAGMQLLFVLTPVFWVPNEQQRANILVQSNPLYHMLEIVRAPLLGGYGTPENWIVSLVVAIGVLVLGAVVYRQMRPKIVYWI